MRRIIIITILIFSCILCACHRNIDDKHKKFEKATTTSYVETTTKNNTQEIESTTVEPSFREYGIYISEDNNNEFICIDDRYITFWNVSKLDAGQTPEYYSAKGHLQYYEQYLRRDFIEANEITIREDVIEYDNKKWLYSIDFTYKNVNDYNINLTGIPQYDEIINKLLELRFSESFNDSQLYFDNGLSHQWADLYTSQNSGFYLVDLDGDGSPEMLLGENNNSSNHHAIYEIYTIKNEVALKLCNGGQRNYYCFCEDDLIYSDGYGSENDPIEGYHKLENGEFVFQKSNGYRYPDTDIVPIEFTLFCVPILYK